MEHESKARKSSKKYFHNAISKYGSDLKWEVICSCIGTFEDLKQLEISFINNNSSEYNLTEGGQGTVGYRHTTATKLKMSKAKKGSTSPRKDVKLSDSQVDNLRKVHPHMKEIICVELNINFPSIGEASRKLNINSANISQVCNGLRKTAGKLTFRFAEKGR